VRWEAVVLMMQGCWRGGKERVGKERDFAVRYAVDVHAVDARVRLLSSWRCSHEQVHLVPAPALQHTLTGQRFASKSSSQYADAAGCSPFEACC
jgi:hypothetical protein